MQNIYEIKQTSIDKLFEKLPETSFVCHWHKMDIINAYVDKYLNPHPIRQKFAYNFDVNGEKCQIENCECDAEIKLVKREGLDLEW